jgi:predicted DsbA family dithiol-disulfide isomerase
MVMGACHHGGVTRIEVTHFSDPCCPWAYSASPAHAVLRWRYGAQLDWRLRLIGLTEEAAQYVARGYTPTRSALGYKRFRRFGMPLGGQPRERVTATGRACRAVVATRLLDPPREMEAFRALQLAQFTTTLLLDTDDGLREALAHVDGLDVEAVLEALDRDDVERAYQDDRAAARTAEGSATEAMGRAARTDGPVRYTAPSLLFRHPDGRVLDGGGFQPLEAYDVLLANLEPRLERRAPAENPVEVLRVLPFAATTREIAACMTPNLAPVDDDAAEEALIEAAGAGTVVREPVGDRALWRLDGERRFERQGASRSTTQSQDGSRR